MLGQSTALQPLKSFPMRLDGPMLSEAVQTGVPFTVAGPQGVIVGQQQGEFESWILPVKLMSHLQIEAHVDNYAVPLDITSMARQIEVRPDRTTITFSHIAMTLKMTIFAPDKAPDGTGAVVLLQLDSVSPLNLQLSFTPEMRPMWPERGFGSVSPEWIHEGKSGYYVLHTDYPEFAGAIALPGAVDGVMAPYQERPKVHPLELKLRYDPKVDGDQMYPLLMAVGETKATATNEALHAKLLELDQQLPEIYAASAANYAKQEAERTSIQTPDTELNENFGWAETSIGQLRAKSTDGETALVAGYYASGDSARPGFGWYFGRDALYTIYALNSYGDFDLSKTELSFLLKRQRADGKMMHEYSQTAGTLDWAQFPYEYAAADATPLFLTTLLDYVKSSGDVAYVKANREAVMKAWQFETTHDADGDGIYDNTQGTGWVESWPGGMPKQEVYLALLDQQASLAMAQLSTLLGDAATADKAAARAEAVGKTIEREYFREGRYAFSWDNGKADMTATVFPAVAWWNSDAGLEHPKASLRAWASHRIDTDWGTRDVDETASVYDPTSYHQGSVWPLFTGWASLAEYRGGQPLAGYEMLMQNASLTRAQDLGAVTELLSGAFYEPFGRSTSHQLWSSAMVITPVLRGMFGLGVDALKHTVKVEPRLPADWNEAAVRRLRVGDAVVDVSYKREPRAMVVSLTQIAGPKVTLAGGGTMLRVPLPAVELSLTHAEPARGARTSQMKVLQTTYEAHELRLELEGVGGTENVLRVRKNDAVSVRAEGAALTGDELRVKFPGRGYQTQVVTLRW
ncbi:amylo-alpha-1,6-glucosidase [Granulicella paludicola]|uniref:amylo-alpha-1,6-glucosidase n=1 Tax=Granulicella paludicola TaxID=474951 RepID=UPI0037BE4D2F